MVIDTSHWSPPKLEDKSSDSSDKYYDFWIEGELVGAVGGKTFLNGQLLHGVRDVQTSVDVAGVTVVSITFLARSLNKGERPSEVTYCTVCPHAMHLHTEDGHCGGGCH